LSPVEIQGDYTREITGIFSTTEVLSTTEITEEEIAKSVPFASGYVRLGSHCGAQ
jgi:hypothetical protein